MGTNTRILRRRTWGHIWTRSHVAGEKQTRPSSGRAARWSWTRVAVRMMIGTLIVLWLVLVVWVVPAG
jgi:hypothetical protein